MKIIDTIMYYIDNRLSYTNKLRLYFLLVICLMVIPMMYVSYTFDLSMLGYVCCAICLCLGYLMKVYEI